jgi:transposase-like protein
MKALTTEVVETGEKRDERGRRILPAEGRDALVAAYEGSGLTQRAFAAREGVKFTTFVSWLARRRRRGGVPRKPAFTEVSLPALSRPGLIEVVLIDGIVVRGADVEQLSAVVAKLRRC